MSKQPHEIIRAFIASNFYVPDAQALGDDTSLLDQGIVDSTGVLEVTAFLESEFGIKVADDEIVPENLDTIANIVAFVRCKTKEPVAAGAAAVAGADTRTSAVPA
ncbi:MAG: acyl carrier protein [Polyangiaceae bacterium]|nr:acyl carrier protein [Polyangiaceae bacterium]